MSYTINLTPRLKKVYEMARRDKEFVEVNKKIDGTNIVEKRWSWLVSDIEKFIVSAAYMGWLSHIHKENVLKYIDEFKL